MDIHEDPEVSGAEKVTRIGCGGIFGLLLGLYLVVKFSISSFGFIAAMVVVAIIACAYLALKYGDEFWWGIFGGKK